jgi:site-specific recombinase XerD
MKLNKFLSQTYGEGTVGAVAQRFIRKRDERGLSTYSLAHLCASLAPFCAAHPVPCAALTARQVIDYINHLHRTYAPRTVKGIRGDIKQFLRWAGKKGLAPRKIYKRLPHIKTEATDKSTTISAVAMLGRHLAGNLTQHIYRDLFGNLCWEPPHQWGRLDRLYLRDLTVLVMLYESGARRGELAELGTAAVHRAIHQQHNGVLGVEMFGKTGLQKRWFTRASLELMQCWLAVRHQPNHQLFIYSDRGAAPIQPGSISLMLARRCREANITPFRTHSLRHLAIKRAKTTFGLEMANKIIDHSTLASTVDYAAVGSDEVRSAVALLGWQSPLF